VKVLARDVGTAEAGDDAVDHPGRAAEEGDVAVGDIRHQLGQVRPRQQIAPPRVEWSPAT
jgi:hypothetical protein